MLEPDEVEEIEEVARPLVHGGFLDQEEAVEAVVESFEDQYAEEDLAAVVDRLWRERLAEQAGWPAETATERVLAALESLSERGIVARADFTCCGTCGAAEIGAEASEGDRGYVFFHQQNTESAVVGGGLYLSYGTFDGTDSTVIGHEVVSAMTVIGQSTVWNGSARQCILVSPLEWQLRLV
jgi:hypothetical protein